MVDANNEAEIRRRGGWLCGDDDFEIVRCVHCRAQYLYNSEVLMLYLEPGDLSRRCVDYVGAEPQTCRQCGACPLEWEEVPASARSEAAEGPWAWAI